MSLLSNEFQKFEAFVRHVASGIISEEVSHLSQYSFNVAASKDMLSSLWKPLVDAPESSMELPKSASGVGPKMFWPAILLQNPAEASHFSQRVSACSTAQIERAHHRNAAKHSRLCWCPPRTALPATTATIDRRHLA